MSPENTGKVKNMAAMPPNATIKQEPDKSGSPATLSEAEFLADQARQAKGAIATVWSELKHTVLSKADPIQLAQRHPKSALGAAAAAGLVAVWVMVPSREDRLSKKRAKMERTIFSNDGNAASGTRFGSFFSGMGAEIFKTLRPVILSAVSAGLSAKASPSSESHPESTDTPTNTS